jgi:hypothetical protein
MPRHLSNDLCTAVVTGRGQKTRNYCSPALVASRGVLSLAGSNSSVGGGPLVCIQSVVGWLIVCPDVVGGLATELQVGRG